MPKTLDAIIQDLTRESMSWDSIQCEISIRQDLLITIGSTSPRSGTKREEFMALATGPKKYGLYHTSETPPKCVLLGYSDGTRCVSVEYRRPPDEARQRSITITKTFLHEQASGYVNYPEPLRFQFVGLVPLREAIQRAEQAGPSRVAGRDCSRFYFSGVPGGSGTQDLLYHLDDLTSVPLKVEAYANRDRWAAAKPSTVWEAKRLDEVQTFHVATDSHYAAYINKPDVQPVLQLTEDYHIDSIRYNEPIPASAFWPVYDPGVYINDLIAGKEYYNTPDKKAPKQAVAKEETTSTSTPAPAPPIVAEKSTDWTAFLSGAGVALGVAVLVAGLVLKLRGR